MSVIAVTLGFLAETVRDSISEKHREKDYIIGLMSNLRDDTDKFFYLDSLTKKIPSDTFPET